MMDTTSKANVLRILIADDDVIDREAIRRTAIQGNKNIIADDAESGEECLQKLASFEYDCVFLDYLMPDIDGVSLLKKVYNPDDDNIGVPVVMLTGRGSEAVMSEALRWGAQDYIVKDSLGKDSLRIAMVKARELFDLKKKRKSAEEALRSAMKMEAIGQLTSRIAHDFNNMLTVIFGNTRIIRHALGTPGSPENVALIEKKIITIEEAAKHGSDLISRLMVFARQAPLDHKIIEINQFISEIRNIIQDTIGSDIKLEFQEGQGIPNIRTDAVQLESVIINIAANARDAMNGNGNLKIKTYAENIADMPVAGCSDPYVVISIQDDGCGMDEIVIEKIFDPLFTTKPAGQGTGLGLSSANEFVRQSGGFLRVQSNPGTGSIFHICLPAHPGA